MEEFMKEAVKLVKENYKILAIAAIVVAAMLFGEAPSGV